METPRERGGISLSHGMNVTKTGRYASVPAGFVYEEYRAEAIHAEKPDSAPAIFAADTSAVSRPDD